MKERSKKTLKSNQAELKKALIKKALGYDATEVVEEYVSSEEGEVKLTKKKVTKKNVPPDITALKILIEEENGGVMSMTDEQLLEEYDRLLELLGSKEKLKGEKN